MIALNCTWRGLRFRLTSFGFPYRHALLEDVMGQVLRERLPVVNLTWDGQTSCVACVRPMRLHHWKRKCNGFMARNRDRP